MRMRWIALVVALGAVAGGGGFEQGDAEAWGTHEAALTITTEDQVVARLPASTGAGYGYGEYLPPGYLTSTASYPVIIHLNGKGEFGTSPTEADLLNVVTSHGAVQEHPLHEPGQGVLRAAPGDGLHAARGDELEPAAIDAFISFLVANYRVDTTRIYLTGISFGGYGSWQYAYTYGSRLAALAPMATTFAGRGPPSPQPKNVPVWEATEQIGDQFQRLALDEPQHPRQPLVARQLIERAVDAHDLRPLLRAGAAVDEIGLRADVQLAKPAPDPALAQPAPRASHDDASQPRPHGGRIAKLRQPAHAPG